MDQYPLSESMHQRADVRVQQEQLLAEQMMRLERLTELVCQTRLAPDVLADYQRSQALRAHEADYLSEETIALEKQAKQQRAAEHLKTAFQQDDPADQFTTYILLRAADQLAFVSQSDKAMQDAWQALNNEVADRIFAADAPYRVTQYLPTEICYVSNYDGAAYDVSLRTELAADGTYQRHVEVYFEQDRASSDFSYAILSELAPHLALAESYLQSQLGTDTP